MRITAYGLGRRRHPAIQDRVVNGDEPILLIIRLSLWL